MSLISNTGSCKTLVHDCNYCDPDRVSKQRQSMKVVCTLSVYACHNSKITIDRQVTNRKAKHSGTITRTSM